MKHRHAEKIKQLAETMDYNHLIKYISDHFYEKDVYTKQLHQKMQEVTIAVARSSGIPYDDLRKNDKCNKREYVFVRQKVMYVTWILTRKSSYRASLKEIGAFFSNKDHATVLHSIKNIKALMSYERNLVREIESYCEVFKETFSGA